MMQRWMRVLMLALATMAGLAAAAPATAQSNLPAVPNVRFTDDAGTFAWDKPATGTVLDFSVDIYGSDGTSTATEFFHPGRSARSAQISSFDPTWDWRVRVRANYSINGRAYFGPWSAWVYWYVPTPTPTATPTPSGAVVCENLVDNGAYKVSCTFTLRNSEGPVLRYGWLDQPGSGQVLLGYIETAGATLTQSILPDECGKTLQGRAIAFDTRYRDLAAVDFSHELVCPTLTPTPSPTATDTPTPTPAPTGSVACENQVVSGGYRLTCDFTLGNSNAKVWRVGWSAPTVFGYSETEGTRLEAEIQSQDCAKTLHGEATAFDNNYRDLVTVDFSHLMVCPTLTPTATYTPTATPTLIPLAVPGNLRVTDFQDVAWDAVTGATLYRVEWSPTISGTGSKDVTGTTFFLGNMVFDQKYTLRVMALTNLPGYVQGSAWTSKIEMVHPSPKELPAPGNLRHTGGGEVAWDAVTGAQSYWLGAWGPGNHYYDGPSTTGSYSFGMSSPGSYRIEVRALGDGTYYEWNGEKAKLSFSIATPTPEPTDTPVPRPPDDRDDDDDDDDDNGNGGDCPRTQWEYGETHTPIRPDVCEIVKTRRLWTVACDGWSAGPWEEIDRFEWPCPGKKP